MRPRHLCCAVHQAQIHCDEQCRAHALMARNLETSSKGSGVTRLGKRAKELLLGLSDQSRPLGLLRTGRGARGRGPAPLSAEAAPAGPLQPCPHRMPAGCQSPAPAKGLALPAAPGALLPSVSASRLCPGAGCGRPWSSPGLLTDRSHPPSPGPRCAPLGRRLQSPPLSSLLCGFLPASPAPCPPRSCGAVVGGPHLVQTPRENRALPASRSLLCVSFSPLCCCRHRRCSRVCFFPTRVHRLPRSWGHSEQCGSLWPPSPFSPNVWRERAVVPPPACGVWLKSLNSALAVTTSVRLGCLSWKTSRRLAPPGLGPCLRHVQLGPAPPPPWLLCSHLPFRGNVLGRG